MDFDNATNLKATILNEVMEQSALEALATAAATEGRHQDVLDDEDLRRPDVQIGVGVGAAQGERGRSGYEVVVFHRGQRVLGLLDRIDQIAGGKTRIRRVAVGRVRTASGSVRTVTHRPLRIGSSVSHHQATAGTLACFVKVKGDQQPCLLSNNHVIANIVGRIGDGVVQPGAFDGGRLATHRVANLHAAVPLNFGSSKINYVDCAAAQIMANNAATPLLPDAADLGLLPAAHRNWLDGIAPPTRLRKPVAVPFPAPPEPAQTVWKYGRTSEWTPGIITAVDVSIRVAMRVNKKPRIASFDGQVSVSGLADHGAFAKLGDSGSLVVLPNGSPIALVFAVTDTGGVNGRGLAFANPFVDVLSRLDASLCL